VRLEILHRGHRFKARALLAMIRLLSGHRVHDIIRTLMYRPEFFGQRNSKLVQEVMRGPSAWTVGDRELMAALVSKANACEF
jgi:hypothetical protein